MQKRQKVAAANQTLEAFVAAPDESSEAVRYQKAKAEEGVALIGLVQLDRFDPETALRFGTLYPLQKPGYG